jgi:hypothetical protein
VIASGRGTKTSVLQTPPMPTRNFIMRRELDAFFKATERWRPRPAERLARCVTDQREMAMASYVENSRSVLRPHAARRSPLALLFRDMSGFKSVAEYPAAWQGKKN